MAGATSTPRPHGRKIPWGTAGYTCSCSSVVDVVETVALENSRDALNQANQGGSNRWRPCPGIRRAKGCHHRDQRRSEEANQRQATAVAHGRIGPKLRSREGEVIACRPNSRARRSTPENPGSGPGDTGSGNPGRSRRHGQPCHGCRESRLVGDERRPAATILAGPRASGALLWRRRGERGPGAGWLRRGGWEPPPQG